MVDCLLCGGEHPDGVTCPRSRTGQSVAGKYTLGPLLGVGGIAAVYAAEHPMLGRPIAIKILHRHFAKDRELSARFIREARETAALGHPAFVRVYDAGTTDDGCPYIEMDRLVGQELYSLRKQHGPLEPEYVAWIAIQILDALAVLHARSVIHRDLKTQNIYLVPEPGGTGSFAASHAGLRPTVKLLDLGFAKVADNLQLTSKDHILGTPFYISPEQYNDPSAVDGRADLFSLGVVMFECLVGDWPYAWTNKRELLGKVMRGELERHPAARRPDVPPWLDGIVAKALAHARDDRFPDAPAMKAALEARTVPGGSGEDKGILSRLFGL